jgi:hypothetical protein
MAFDAVGADLTLEDVKLKLITQSQKFGSKSSFAAYSNTGKPYKANPEKARLNCTHCKKSGHIKDQCFKLNPKLRKNNGIKTKPQQKQYGLFAGLKSKSPNTTTWILDSGASQHITNDKTNFTVYKESSTTEKIYVADGNYVLAFGKGTCSIRLNDKHAIDIEDVWYAPDFATNLMSVSSLTNANYILQFDSYQCTILHQDTILGKFKLQDNLYSITIYPMKAYHQSTALVQSKIASKSSYDINDLHILHGHVNHKTLRTMVKHKLLQGVSSVTGNERQCESCILAKLVKQPYPKESFTIAKQPLSLWVIDNWGPAARPTIHGERTKTSIIDANTGFQWKLLLQRKSDCDPHLRRLILREENRTGFKLQKIRIDNGELKSSSFQQWCKDKQPPIEIEFTVPFSSAQIGDCERTHRTDRDGTDVLITSAKLPYSLWGYACQYQCYLRNRTLTKHNKELITPLELYLGIQPIVATLIFGQAVYFTLTKQSKLFNRADIGYFLGHPEGVKGIYIYHNGKIKITRSWKAKNSEMHDDAINDSSLHNNARSRIITHDS